MDSSVWGISLDQQLGHYKIIRLIGRGGMGSVYQAHEMSLNRMVAIKVLGEHLTEDETNISRFRREAQSVAALNHPNVIQIYFIGEDKGKHFFVMEFVDGVTLKELILKTPRPSIQQTVSLMRQASVGLAAAHDRGLIHRDIKPANLMVNQDGILKIADFGLAFRPEDQTKLTASGMFLGTPGYLAPEQCTGEPPDGRTDIYALGMTMYEMLVGRSAFGDESLPPLALIQRVMHEQPIPVMQANPQVDAALGAIVDRMIAKRREERYSSCHELLRDLDAFLGAAAAPWKPASDTMPLPATPPPVPATPAVAEAPTTSNAPTQRSDDATPPDPRWVHVPGETGRTSLPKPVFWGIAAGGSVLVVILGIVLGVALKPEAPTVGPDDRTGLEDSEIVGDPGIGDGDVVAPYESNQFFSQEEEAPEQAEPVEAEPGDAIVVSPPATHSNLTVETKPHRPASANREEEKPQEKVVPPASRMPPGIAICLQRLRSPDDAQKRLAARTIVKRFPQHPRLLEAAKEELLAGYTAKPDENLHVDAMAWLCRALGHSGQSVYLPTLEKVAAESPSRKIKKFAEAAAADLR